MSEDIRITYTGSDPLPPEWQQAADDATNELKDAIRRSGDPGLLGNWTMQAVPPTDPGNKSGSRSGRIAVDVREYLDALDPRDFQAYVRSFRNEIHTLRSTEEIRARLHAILFPAGLRSITLPASIVRIPPMRALYRVRANITNPSQIQTVADVWCRPDGGTPGRINRKGQRILYLSAETAYTALVESKPQNRDFVAVSQFVASDPILVMDLRETRSQVKLSVSQQRKLKALDRFFTWVFNYSGHDPEKPQYEAAQVIALEFNVLPLEAMGWGYQSALIDSTHAYNIALEADRAKKTLRLVNTQIFHYREGPEPSLRPHSSLVPARPNVDPRTALVAGPAQKFKWDVPPQIHKTY